MFVEKLMKSTAVRMGMFAVAIVIGQLLALLIHHTGGMKVNGGSSEL